MTECSSGSDTYLDYKCYKLLKPKFDIVKLEGYGLKYFDEAKGKIKKYHKNLEAYEQFFKNISSYLQHDGVFIYADRRIPCTYINYLLNKKVIKDGMYLSNPDYEILKDFVKKFHESKSSLQDGEICSSKIEYLDYKEYLKMELLYDLYDKYITLVTKYNPQNYNLCNILGIMISLYNESIKYHQRTDKNLINKLIHLKQLIDKNILPNYRDCQKDITHFSLSEKEIEEQQRLAEKQKQLEHAKRLAEQEQEEKAKQRQAEQEMIEQAKQRLAEQGQLERVELQGHLQKRPVRTESNEQGQRYQIPTIQPTLLPYNQQIGLAESSDSQTFGESGPSEIKIEPLKDQGLLGQMQNTFSSIVQNVDPAPVLGVSGGMGVLFILFKYTPVGSFFGGRRGRFRQIPSTFRGFPPGEFPNFQEYEGGFIGYAPMNINPLAE